MKKVICIMMAFVITLTCCMAAYAATSTPKISADVERKISETPDGEKFEVLLWLNVNVPTVEELRWMVRQELGEEWWRDHFGPNMTMDDVHTYDAVYNRLAKQYETAANQAFVEKSRIPEEDVVYISTMAPMVQLLANAQTIYRLAEMTEVESISYEGYQQTEEAAEHPTELRTETQLTSSAPLYQTQFEAYLNTLPTPPEFWNYSELYYHKDKNGENDWVLVKADSNMEQPAYYNAIIANRVIMRSSYGVPFSSGYGVYDVKADRFINVSISDYSEYDGFANVFDRYGGGRLLGDIDRDNDLSVIDAAFLQRCEVKQSDYPADDAIIPEDGLWIYSAKYYSDFNRDGERGILDVTCLQRHLAGLTYTTG